MSDLVILGSGRIAAGIVRFLEERRPRFRVDVVSRTPRELPGTRVRTRAGPPAPGPAPLLLTSSVDEAALIRDAAGGHDIPREVVARANLEYLATILDPVFLEGRTVMVITNPVERICGLVHHRAPGAHILGLGMTTDRQRLAEALSWLTGLPVEETSVDVTGRHDAGPVPVLSARPELRERIAATDPARVASSLEEYTSPFCSEPHRVAGLFRSWVTEITVPRESPAWPYHLVDVLLRAITLSEFEAGRPPSRRPIAALSTAVLDLLEARPLDASGLATPRDSGHFVGGRFDPVTGSFRIPAHDATEAQRIDAAHARAIPAPTQAPAGEPSCPGGDR